MSNDDYSFGSPPSSPPSSLGENTPTFGFGDSPSAPPTPPNGYTPVTDPSASTTPPPPGYSQSPYSTPPPHGSQGHAPYPGYYPGHPPAAPGKGMAITALILGSISLLFAWIPVLNLFTGLLGVVGLILGIIAIVQAYKGRAAGQGMAITGTILSLVSICIGALITIGFLAAVGEEVQRMEQDGFVTYNNEEWPGMDLDLEDLYYDESF